MNPDYPDSCLEAERREDAAEFARDQRDDQEYEQWLLADRAGQAERNRWLAFLRDDKDTKMKLNDMIESTYLKQEDVDGDVLVTVESLKKVNIARDDEEARYKWIVKFEEFPKGMALNVTNLKRMFRFLGDDSDNWIGGKVIVYADPDVEYKGETVGGLRIKSGPRAKTKLSPEEVNRKLSEAADDSVPF